MPIHLLVTFWLAGGVESELLHTYSRVDALDVLVLLVRLAVLVAVTLTVPVVLFPVRTNRHFFFQFLWNNIEPVVKYNVYNVKHT